MTTTKPAPIKWKRTYDGLKSANGRFEIIRRTEYILGTKCVSFVLYDNKIRVPGYHRQSEAKALAAAEIGA
jgi:hypothetical protein